MSVKAASRIRGRRHGVSAPWMPWSSAAIASTWITTLIGDCCMENSRLYQRIQDGVS